MMETQKVSMCLILSPYMMLSFTIVQIHSISFQTCDHVF